MTYNLMLSDTVAQLVKFPHIFNTKIVPKKQLHSTCVNFVSDECPTFIFLHTVTTTIVLKHIYVEKKLFQLHLVGLQHIAVRQRRQQINAIL